MLDAIARNKHYLYAKCFLINSVNNTRERENTTTSTSFTQQMNIFRWIEFVCLSLTVKFLLDRTGHLNEISHQMAAVIEQFMDHFRMFPKIKESVLWCFRKYFGGGGMSFAFEQCKYKYFTLAIERNEKSCRKSFCLIMESKHNLMIRLSNWQSSSFICSKQKNI